MASFDAMKILFPTFDSNARSRIEQEHLAAEHQARSQAMLRQNEAAERERSQRLARDVATARAVFASRGVSGDGSAAALIDGLFQESAEERRERLEAMRASLADSERNLRYRRSLGLLDTRRNQFDSLFKLLSSQQLRSLLGD